jgi:hypothetical protein
LLRLASSPVRVMLGLPPYYGMTVGNRALQILRGLGLYRGRIHYVVKVKGISVGVLGGRS